MSGRPRKVHTAEWPELLGMRDLVRWLRAYRGEGMSPAKIHRLVATDGFPAYSDPLCRTRKGEPRLVFRRSEVEAWFEARLRRITPAPTSPIPFPASAARIA